MHKRLRIGYCVGVLAAAAALSAPAWAAADGQLMEVTVRVQQQMEGMPTLPAHTMSRKICTKDGSFDRHTLEQLQSRTECSITHYEKQGNVVTFDATCTGPVSVTSHGEFHLTGGSDFTGTMRTSMQAAGHAMTVDTAYTGKKIGSCTPEA